MLLLLASCVPDDIAGIEFDIPINSGPEPQRVQPATPAPPLPTDTVHTIDEWPPKAP